MDEWVMERYELAKERIAQIPDEKMVEEPYCDFFTKEAMFLQQVIHVMDHGIAGKNLEELQEQNHELYQDILPENYENSYGNPAYAQKMLGEYGKVFTFLYTELHGTIAYAFEKKAWDLTVVLELFLEIYSAFTQEEIPAEKQVKEILVSYVNDYCQDMVENRIREAIDPENNFVVEMIMDSDLSDLSYLYQSGEYVSENELKTAEFMNSLSQREIDEMARTYTEGYRMGFITGRKDITKKKTVNIRYHLGFERMVKAAVLQFREMGLQTVIYRHALHAVNRRNQFRNGFTGGIANPQFDYDHRQDSALFLDPDFVKRKLRAMQTSYDEYADLADVHGGPAVIETFGEKPFSPVSKPESWAFTEAQQKAELKHDFSEDFVKDLESKGISRDELEGMQIKIESNGNVTVSGIEDKEVREQVQKLVEEKYSDRMYQYYTGIADSVGNLSSNTYQYATDVQEVRRYLKGVTGEDISLENLYLTPDGKIGGLPEKAANLINKTKDNAKIERIKDALINIIGHNRTSGDLGIPDFTSEFQFSNGAFSVADSGFTVDMAALDRRLTPQPHDNMYSDMYAYSFRKVL